MLILKLALAPLLIALVSLAGQSFGPRIAGVLAGFPIISGPIFIVVTLEQGIAFGYRAACATLAGLLAFSAYAVCYVRLARHFGWPLTLLASWMVFALVSVSLLPFEWPLPVDIGIAVASLLLAYRLVPQPRGPAPAMELPRGEILLRMAAGAALVLAVTALARAAGPRLSGLLTPFPVAGSVLAACSHRVGGVDAVARLLHGMMGGLTSLAAFFAMAALLLQPAGLGIAVAAGLAVAVAIQLGLLALHWRAEVAE